MSTRLSQVATHLSSPTSARKAEILKARSPDDVVIVAAARSPMSRARKGPLSSLMLEDLLSPILVALIQRAGISDPSIIDDILIGSVRSPVGAATVSRMAALHAGIPESVPISTINRQCASSLTGASNIAYAIKAGAIDIGIAAGMESMTHHFKNPPPLGTISEEVKTCSAAADCLIPMGITSDTVARTFNITRDRQEAFASSSHQKAAAARSSGRFKEEIIPYSVLQSDGSRKVVAEDDGIRPGTTPETLSKLPPAFDKAGTTTAGTSSQTTDGASGIILARRSVAEKYKLPILARWITSAFVGVPPHIMGIGPAVAIPKALKNAGLSVDDIDWYEINEAFASQAIYCVDSLGIPYEKVNPNGSGISLGHPLGATGTRQITTGIYHCRNSGKGDQLFITSMCAGSGMGAAGIFAYESH